MALFDQLADQFDLEFKGLSETVHRRFANQGNALSAHLAHDRAGIRKCSLRGLPPRFARSGGQLRRRRTSKTQEPHPRAFCQTT
jgi:hypothetical protein